MMVRWQLFTSTSEGFGKTKMTQTMSNGLQERQSAPLTLPSSAEPLNATNLSILEATPPESSKSGLVV